MRQALIALLVTLNLYSFEISNYHQIYGCILDNNSTINMVIREFKYKDKSYYLALNPNSLTTKIINAKTIYRCSRKLNATRYIKLKLKALSNFKHPLQNDGITSATKGVYLTIDLCPSSKKGFEDELFKTVIKNFKNPVPVTIFITKRWIDSHKLEFNWLKLWQKEGKLDITWGNHTANHIYHPKEPLDKNFVLSKEEHLKDDILSLEKSLIENGLTPSIFFRFPGLVSNKDAIENVANLGLITIGSNAWLAKGQRVKDGSIILVHGNKNEPKGVKELLNLIKDNKIKELKSLKELD